MLGCEAENALPVSVKGVSNVLRVLVYVTAVLMAVKSVLGVHFYLDVFSGVIWRLHSVLFWIGD